MVGMVLVARRLRHGLVGYEGRMILENENGDPLLTKEVGWASNHRYASKSIGATHDVPIDIMLL